MTFVGCSIGEQLVNPLFEVFDGGDFALSSYRDIEDRRTTVRVYFEDPARTDEARRALVAALEVVGSDAVVETGEIPDDDWKFAYRRHFKTEPVGSRLLIVPEWELENLEGGELRKVVHLDPGMAFGTGKHETTRACLEYIDELSPVETFLDMGCGSGILSIAAAKLGCGRVKGFDLDPEAVKASIENAEKNGVKVEFVRFALGRAGAVAQSAEKFELVVANILGPLLIKFADEILLSVGDRLVVSGILNELYPEVCAAFAARGLQEVSHKTIGEWTTGLLRREVKVS